MKRLNHSLTLAGVITVLGLSAGYLAAQGQDLRNLDWQNMDPQQIRQEMQKRMMENYRQQFAITNDAEWKIVEERISKVSEARMATLSGGAGMMGFGGFGGRGGNQGLGRAFQGILGEPSAETQALQKAVDAKASSAEIKEKLARYLEARKQKEASLAKAQEDLRNVLTVRQEATAVLIGLL